MNHLAVWGGIAAVVIASTVGDVLQSRAMKEIGNPGRFANPTASLA